VVLSDRLVQLALLAHSVAEAYVGFGVLGVDTDRDFRLGDGLADLALRNGA